MTLTIKRQALAVLLALAALTAGLVGNPQKAEAVSADASYPYIYITFNRSEVVWVDGHSGYAATAAAACGLIPKYYAVVCGAVSTVFITAVSNTFHAANLCDGKVVIKLLNVSIGYVMWDVYKSACNIPGGGGGGGSW